MQPYPQIPVITPVAPAVQTAPNPAYNSPLSTAVLSEQRRTAWAVHVGRRLHLQATRTKHIDFLMNIGASDFVLDTIRNGCVISFVNPPVSMQVGLAVYMKYLLFRMW